VDPPPEEHQAPTQPGYYQPPPGQYQPPPPGYYQPPPGQQGYYPGAPPPYWNAPVVALSPQEERTWAMLAHISSIIAGFVLGLSFLGPLIVMLTQGTKSAFVRRHAVESLNFQLTVLIITAVGTVLSIVLLIVTLGLGLLVLIPVAAAALIAALVFTVMGAVKANNGEDYRYPINIRMVN
jgi:uncharacterized Tic20 family protein